MIELSEQVGSYGIGMYSAMLGSGTDADLVERTAVSDDYLASFDALRPKILKAAQAAYKAKNAQSIMLDLENFK